MLLWSFFEQKQENGKFWFFPKDADKKQNQSVTEFICNFLENPLSNFSPIQPTNCAGLVIYMPQILLWIVRLDFEMIDIFQNQSFCFTVAMVTGAAWEPMRK